MYYHFVLPEVPNTHLNPNNRYKSRNANIRVQREAKDLVAKHTEYAPQFPPNGPVLVDWHVFWHKGGKTWDKDNLIAALKYHQDTLAKAIGINDSRVTSSVHQHRDVTGKGFMLCLVEAKEDES